MMTEFSAIAMNMNDSTVEKCRVIRQSFSDALSAIKQHIKPGRELALATTKMQEACMWAIRGVAMDPANQHPTQPGSEGESNTMPEPQPEPVRVVEEVSR